MSFSITFKIAKQVLSNIGITLNDEKEYDGIAIKKIAASNTLDKGKSGSQTHIAITGAQLDIFPYLRAEGYFNTQYQSKDDNLKKYFSLRVPIILNSKNCKYLKATDTQSCEEITTDNLTTIQTYSHVLRSRRDGETDQVQVSLLNYDHPDFLKFRKLIHSDDFMIILKQKQKFNYEFYGVRAKDSLAGDSSLASVNNTFEKTNTITYVNATNILSDESIKELKQNKDVLGSNVIHYGAPGTGKSYTLEKESQNFDFVERVTFYPEYSHDDFIGCFMPCMSYIKKDTAEYISIDGTSSNLPGKPIPYYTFVPGPFTNALVNAFNNTDKNVLLIVEELNRANAAAVFGEVFQLLDRTNTGESKYSISVSNEYSEYLASKIFTYSKGQKVTIPNNLTICATMNSADQGVNPLDSAFKRRWNFKYVPIDFKEAIHKNYQIDYAKKKVTWEVFATTINKKLKEKDINEDKHLGQYFITETEIKDSYKFASKILLYLFDDVLKFNRRGFFKNYKTFSDLLTDFNGGEEVFDFSFEYVVQAVPSDATDNEIALDTQVSDTVSENSEVIYNENIEDQDVSRVAEDSSNDF
ncbi:AAA family ATPase [Clostridium tetani]|uniref:AAA family ATPase n=1 Tax=Clostridium tetani TaxID=1513 RepID=UPI00100BE122|nr:AAA family ATPase [Clostridium tetani]RXM70701.1 hypothetical protein DP139_05475 [Clostridium tetani]